MNAVIYARYSSSNQTEQSIEGQMRCCKEFADHEDITIIGEYIDRGISAKTDNRPQFQKMIKDSENGNFQIVLVYKLDRFARNRYDSAIYKSKLRKNGVKVISATERISDSPEGIIMEGLLEAMDEYYSAELSRKCKRGIRESIIKGNNTGGTPYGYRRENKRLMIDEIKALAVKQIFEMYTTGNTLQAIADELNRQGYRSVRGELLKRWHISDILHNDKYTGIHYVSDHKEPEHTPPIIDMETFEKAQTLLKNSAKKARHQRTGHIYALTGLLQCGYCEQAVCGTSTNNGGKHYFYYQCRNKENCNHVKVLQAEWLEDVVIDALQEFLAKGKIDDIVDRIYKIYINQSTPPSKEPQIADIDRQIQNIIKAIANGVTSNALEKKLADLEKQRENLEQPQPQQPHLTKKHFEYALHRLSQILETSDDKRKLFTAMVNNITIFDDEIVIAINLVESIKPPKLVEIVKTLDSVGEKSPLPTQYKILFTPFSLLICAKLSLKRLKG